MVDLDKLAEALGEDGWVSFETADEKGHFAVINGRPGYSTVMLKRVVSIDAVRRALMEDGMNDA